VRSAPYSSASSRRRSCQATRARARLPLPRHWRLPSRGLRAGWSELVGLASGLVAIVVAQVREDRINSVFRTRNFYGTLHVTQGQMRSARHLAHTLQWCDLTRPGGVR
jgi:hypothetical protein